MKQVNGIKQEKSSHVNEYVGGNGYALEAIIVLVLLHEKDFSLRESYHKRD